MLYLLKDYEVFRFLEKEFGRWGDHPWAEVCFTEKQLTDLVTVLRVGISLCQTITVTAEPYVWSLPDRRHFIDQMFSDPATDDPTRACKFLADRLEFAPEAIDFATADPMDTCRFCVGAGTLALTLKDVYDRARVRLFREFGGVVVHRGAQVQERPPAPRKDS